MTAEAAAMSEDHGGNLFDVLSAKERRVRFAPCPVCAQEVKLKLDGETPFHPEPFLAAGVARKTCPGSLKRPAEVVREEIAPKKAPGEAWRAGWGRARARAPERAAPAPPVSRTEVTMAAEYTERQEALLGAIRRFWKEKGRSPTLVEIADEAGILKGSSVLTKQQQVYVSLRPLKGTLVASKRGRGLWLRTVRAEHEAKIALIDKALWTLTKGE